MKTTFSIFFLAFAILFSTKGNAQNVKTVKLGQSTGVFDKTELKLKSSKTYVFEISNNGVDKEVGFVIAPKGKESDQASHIKTAYLSETIADGETGLSKEVTLAPGEYSYFCPLNPTPLYTITVK